RNQVELADRAVPARALRREDLRGAEHRARLHVRERNGVGLRVVGSGGDVHADVARRTRERAVADGGSQIGRLARVDVVGDVRVGGNRARGAETPVVRMPCAALLLVEGGVRIGTFGLALLLVQVARRVRIAELAMKAEAASVFALSIVTG